VSSSTAYRLIAFDFDRDIARLTEGFTGREWIFSEIDHWLKHTDERFFLLTGEPGIGKSALIARFIQRQHDVAAYHFCIAGRNSTITPSTVLRSLAAQLADALPTYGEALANTIDPVHLSVHIDIQVQTMNSGEITGVVINHLQASNPEEELDILLRSPLAALPAPPPYLLILMDSLDEAVTLKHDVNLVTLFAKMNDLPSWVRILCTTRPERRVLRVFDAVKPHLLAAESQMNLDDVRMYITWRLKQETMRAHLQAAGVEPIALLDQLAALANGNFLYTRILLDDIQAGNQKLDDLGRLPKSLDEIYHGFLLRFTVHEWEERYQPLLRLLAVAQEPITEEQLAHFTGIEQDTIRQYMGVVRQFLDTGNSGQGEETYALFHQSLRDYLLDKRRNQDFWCSATTGHQNIARYYLKNYLHRWSTCDDYGLHHLPTHIASAELWDELDTIVTDFDFLEAKAGRLGIDTVIGDITMAQSLPLSKPDPHLNQTDLLRVLEREAHTLRGWSKARNPAFFAQQVYNSAENMGLTKLAQFAATRLDTLGRPHLIQCWRTGRYSQEQELERTLFGHRFFVYALAVTPDGKRVVSGSYDDTVKVWDLHTGREQFTFSGHTGWVRAVAVTLDGRYAISGSHDHTIKMWNLQTGQEERTLIGHSLWIRDLAVTSDDRVVSASWDKTLKVWNLRTGQEERTLIGHRSTVETVAVTLDGRYAISGSSDRSLKVWDLASGEEVRTLMGHTSGVMSVAITPDGHYAVSGADEPDHVLRVWNLQTGQLERTLVGHKGWIKDIAVTSDGQRVISSSSDGIMKIWDLASGSEIHTISGGGYADMDAVAVTPDGQYVISSSRDNTLKVWNLTARTSRSVPYGHEGTVNAIAVTSNSRYAVSGSSDGTIKVWDMASGKEVRTLYDGNMVEAVAVTPDGKRIVSGSWDCALKVWSLRTGRRLRTFTGHIQRVEGVAVTPDGHHAISAAYQSGSTLKVWDISNGLFKREAEYTFSASNAVAVAVTSDGQRAVSASWDKTLTIWNLQTGQQECTLTGHNGEVLAVAVTPDGRRVISGSRDQTLKVWDLASGKELNTLRGHRDVVRGVAVTPDGRYVLSASDDHNLKIWDLMSDEDVAMITLDVKLFCVAVAPDGITIVAGGDGGNLYCLRCVNLNGL